MSKFYPLKFKPIFKEKIWGGQKIRTILKKDFGSLDNCGESWEISGVDGDVSIVSNGELKDLSLTEIIDLFGSDLLGRKISHSFGKDFPLLIKFIDAAKDLSIQVHPNDEVAKERHNSFGKTEMWYIMQADEGATLVSGFNQRLNREQFLNYFNAGELEAIINKEAVNKNDVFYLPAGRIHTIGSGLLLAEIQQTSDVTYRIYDFDRVDKKGQKRALHIEEALDVIDYDFYGDYKTKYPNKPNTSNSVLSTPYFTTNKLNLDRPMTVNRTMLDCFKIYIATAGKGHIAGESIRFGETLLVPAKMNDYTIEPEGELELLETYIVL